MVQLTTVLSMRHVTMSQQKDGRTKERHPLSHLQGWYALFPLEDETTNAYIVGYTALVGGTLFEAGAYCMVVEAVNRGNAVRFGYEVRSCSFLHQSTTGFRM